MKILVLGYIVKGPLGGLAWHHFQYVLGLIKLGHEVLFIEDSDDYPACYNPITFKCTVDPFFGLQFIKDLFKSFDLSNWAYFDAHSNSWFGRNRRKVFDFCKKADLVLNLSGINPVREYWQNIPTRIFIDTDPGFVQINNLTKPNVMELAKAHNIFFSFAENINTPSCTIPADGFLWKPTRQPVFLSAWKIDRPRIDANWTTVMQWDSYKELQYNDVKLGMKSKSFIPFYKLPKFVPNENLEISMGSSSAPRTQLVKLGWQISNPSHTTRNPQGFQDYIRTSKGEWTIAKQGYVITNSGWFSERTLNYMASGKPVIVQDTGFKNFLPTGQGLLCFSNLDEAIDQINRVNADYEIHCLSARRIVEEHFNSTAVLSNLLANIT